MKNKVKVIFENSSSNYVTSVSDQATKESCKAYFVGTFFNVGIFPEDEDMQKCIKIKFWNAENEVLFLIHPEAPEEVFAFWPHLHGSPGFKQCYAHIGQHGSASTEYARESRKATPDEYKELENELLAIGYELEILNNG